MDTTVDAFASDPQISTRLFEAFRLRFGRNAQAAARAPGRVNLIGEHTDYNGGWVLPCAIDRGAFSLLAARDDGGARIWARDLDAQVELSASQVASLATLAPGDSAAFAAAIGAAGATAGAATAPPMPAPAAADWVAYPLAVVRALVERGVTLPGFDLAISSSVPAGSGLSSSAALVVSLTAAFDALLGLGLDAREWAGIAHRAESHHMGVGCGILDHFASALGRRNTALHIDCRSQEVVHAPFPGDALRLLVAHSGVTRRLAAEDGGYRQRVAECAAALEAAKRASLVPDDASSLRSLDGVPAESLEGALHGASLRRARHVVGENARVSRFCAAMASRDFETMGAVLRDGHRSLRDDYQVSILELDALCELADPLPGVLGSRLTGAGFGGCTLHLVEADAATDAARVLADGFESRFARRPPILEARVSDGAAILSLDAI